MALRYTGKYKTTLDKDEDGIQYLYCDFFFIVEGDEEGFEDGEEVYITSPLYQERSDLFCSGVAETHLKMLKGEDPIEAIRSSFRQIWR
jgi:hypothetical protein